MPIWKRGRSKNPIVLPISMMRKRKRRKKRMKKEEGGLPVGRRNIRNPKSRAGVKRVEISSIIDRQLVEMSLQSRDGVNLRPITAFGDWRATRWDRRMRRSVSG